MPAAARLHTVVAGRRVMLGGLLAALLASVSMPASAEEGAVGLDYECSAGLDAPWSADLDLEGIHDHGAVGLEERSELVVSAVLSADPPPEVAVREIEPVEVELDLLMTTASTQDAPRVVTLRGQAEGRDDSVVELRGEHTFDEAGDFQVVPGELTLAFPNRPDEEPSPSPLPEEREGSSEEDAEAADAETTYSAHCTHEGDAPVLGWLEVSQDDEPAEVTTDGGVEWIGTWACVSDEPSLLGHFEAPGTLTLAMPDHAHVGEVIELTARKGSFAGFPDRPATVSAGRLRAELLVELSGSAAPAQPVLIETASAEDFAPDDTDIGFEEADAVPLTLEAEGELRTSLGALTLTTELPQGAVTHVCTADDTLPDHRGQAPEQGKLPVAGAALRGLLLAAALSVTGGAAAFVLGRPRRAAEDA